MKAKYRMTRQQNIFVANRNIVDYMYKSAILEGIKLTYPDTEAIYNGQSVAGINMKDTIAVHNLKYAWQFVLDKIDDPADYSYICKINQIVGGDSLQAGFLRSSPVAIGGTAWKPEMPNESKIKEEIADIQAIENPTDRALTLMLHLMRRQMFFDGNKRTSMLAANQVMISNGCGIISMPVEYQRDFSILLIRFYETNEMQKLKSFIYENCIDGINFENIKETGAPPKDIER